MSEKSFEELSAQGTLAVNALMHKIASGESAGDFNEGYELVHYGVKGMKWGVRTKRTQNIKAARKEVKAAKSDIRKASTPEQKAKLKQQLKGSDAASMAKKNTLGQHFVKGTLAVVGGVTVGLAASAAYALNELGSGPESSDYKLRIGPNWEDMAKLRAEQGKYDVTVPPELAKKRSWYRNTVTQEQHELNVKRFAEALAQSSDNDPVFLEHYGVKGMKWGVRKGSVSSAASSASAKTKDVFEKLTPDQKVKAAKVLIGTGAAAAAYMMAGPVGGMVVSGIARAAESIPTTTTTNTWTGSPSGVLPNGPITTSETTRK